MTIPDIHSAEPTAGDWRMDTKPPIAYVHITVVAIKNLTIYLVLTFALRACVFVKILEWIRKKRYH
jgi:hypothetical protein